MPDDKPRDEDGKRAQKAAMPVHVREAHKHSMRNAVEIEKSDLCGCFYCLTTFAPSDIAEWIEESDEVCERDSVSQTATAKCPRCGIDSVLGSAAGFPLDKQFLQTMHSHWF